MLRSHSAGSLRATDAGQKVTLAGWVARRRDHGGVIFIDLRDSSGVSQVVFREADVLAQAHRLRAEFCVAVDGVVEVRPEGNANAEIATGEIEVNATSLTVLGRARRCRSSWTRPPAKKRGCGTATSTCAARAAWVRRSGCARRSTPPRASVLAQHDFVEIETPTLTRSTPEGARDFLVPARLQPGSFYALPQSPQLFKQLLMVAGMERYYQIARCYRDEDFRADRQPEFTQLDMELSLSTPTTSSPSPRKFLAALWALIGYELPRPIPRMTYADAMRRFGSDKPDLRFGLELVECADYFGRHPVQGVPVGLRRSCRDARRRVTAPPYPGRLAGMGEAAWPPGSRLRADRGGRHAERARRQEPVRCRARRARRPCRRQTRGLHILLCRLSSKLTGPPGCGPR